MVRRLGRVPRGARAAGCSSTPSTSSTATRPTPSSASGCSKRRPWPGPTAWSSATPTAARCPSTSSASWARSSTTSTPSVGVHLHDDTGCGVANALAGVRGGATQVQGTINGYGERTGNCNLTTIIPDLSLKMGVDTIPAERLERLTPVAHHVAELVNISPDPQQAFVGASAFAHKAGLHTSAIARRPDAYEHVDPDLVGNGTRFVVSELAGRSTLELKAQEIGLEMDGPALSEVVDRLKQLEYEGFHFEAADGSLELLMRDADGLGPALLQARVVPGLGRAPGPGRRLQRRPRGRDRHRGDGQGRGRGRAGHRHRRGQRPGQRPGRGPAQGHGDGRAPTRCSAASTSPTTRSGSSTRQKGTGAVTRVLIDSTDGERSWSTIGVSENIIEASWQALADSHHLRPAAQPGARVAAGGDGLAASTSPSRRSTTPGVYTSRPGRPGSWLQDRPADSWPASPGRPPRQPRPDQGFALTLAEQFAGRLAPPARRARGRRHRRLRGGGPQAGVPVRPGAGRPRPHDRLHPLRLPGRAAPTTSWWPSAGRSSRRWPTPTTTPSGVGSPTSCPRRPSA